MRDDLLQLAHAGGAMKPAGSVPVVTGPVCLAGRPNRLRQAV